MSFFCPHCNTENATGHAWEGMRVTTFRKRDEMLFHSDHNLPAVRGIVKAVVPSRSRRIHRADDGEKGTIRLGTHSNGLLVLTMRESGGLDRPRIGHIHLAWTAAGKKHEQELDLPSGWTPETSDPAWTVHAWPKKNATTLEIALHDSNSGTADIFAPVFYHRVGTRWRRTNRNVLPFEFSTYGGMHMAPDHKKLYVWDLVDLNERHQGTHVWLRTFAWRNGSFHIINTRRTRQTYAFPDNGIKGKSISSKRDPLREFGRHWIWWQYE